MFLIHSKKSKNISSLYLVLKGVIQTFEKKVCLAFHKMDLNCFCNNLSNSPSLSLFKVLYVPKTKISIINLNLQFQITEKRKIKHLSKTSIFANRHYASLSFVKQSLGALWSPWDI